MTRNHEWMQRQTASPEARREFEQERMIAWTFELISDAMEASGKSKADLARILETSRANITQLLSGARNATLRTVADLAWACDSRIVMTLEPLRLGDFVEAPVRLVNQVRPRLSVATKECNGEDVVTDIDRLVA